MHETLATVYNPGICLLALLVIASGAEPKLGYESVWSIEDLSKEILYFLSLSDKIQTRYSYIMKTSPVQGEGEFMYYELYLDLFFLENFMIDSILLFAVNRVLRKGKPAVRILLGGALGSILACVTVLMPVTSGYWILLSGIAISSIMILSVFGKMNLRSFLKMLFLLYAAAVVAGGTVMVFRSCIRYAAVFYAAFLFGYMIFMKLWKIAGCFQKNSEKVLCVTLYTDSGKLAVKALWDTGNELVDPYSGRPVNVLDPETAKKWFPVPEAERGFHMIPFRCAGGEAVMNVFHIDRLCIHAEEDRWIQNPVVGIGKEKLSVKNEFELILNPLITVL